MYKFTDLVIATMNRRFIGMFNRIKSLREAREIIKAVDELYEELDEVTRKYLLLIARKIYNTINTEDWIEDMAVIWLMEQLNAYDPVTKYVYTHEVDRKKARLVEAMIASDDKPKEVETAKKLWAKQARQYADNITEQAVLKAYSDMGIPYVRWQTEEDERVCSECARRDGVVYPRKEVPPKPHYGCRCILIGVSDAFSERNRRTDNRDFKTRQFSGIET